MKIFSTIIEPIPAEIIACYIFSYVIKRLVNPFIAFYNLNGESRLFLDFFLQFNITSAIIRIDFSCVALMTV